MALIAAAACVALSDQIHQIRQDPRALHPPDPEVEGELQDAFRDFHKMAGSCSEGDGERARVHLERAARAFAAAAGRLKKYDLQP